MKQEASLLMLSLHLFFKQLKESKNDKVWKRFYDKNLIEKSLSPVFYTVDDWVAAAEAVSK